MTMFGRKFLCVATVAAMSVCAEPAQARDSGQDFGQEDFAPLTSSDRALRPKRPRRFFGRPAKDTPERQLRYAQALQEAGRLRKAHRQFKALVHEWHDADEAPIAQKTFAELLEQRRKYSRAFNEYQYLAHYFPGRFSFRDVFDAQFRIASHLMRQRSFQFLFFSGFDASERALPLFKQILENAPYAERAADAWFHIGTIHEDAKDYVRAADAYETLVVRYPQSDYVSEALYRRAACLYNEAIRHPRDERGLLIAYGALAAWIQQNDGSDRETLTEARQRLGDMQARIVEMHYERAAFYDTLARKPSAAIIAYTSFLEQFPASEHSDIVRARVRELTAKAEQGK